MDQYFRSEFRVQIQVDNVATGQSRNLDNKHFTIYQLDGFFVCCADFHVLEVCSIEDF